jgi:hypothetical protein
MGRNSSGSTPTGTIAILAGSTWWSATMSLNELSDTVTTRSRRRATRVCMLVNEYQRASENFRYRLSACSISRRRSTVIGWWTVARTGRPSRSMARRP